MLRPWKTLFQIAFHADASLVEQIAEMLRQEIARGRLELDSPLPGTRTLALELGVNRKTVVFAYENLIAEGWLYSEYKKGTFVCSVLPDHTSLNETAKTEKLSSTFSFQTQLPHQFTDRPLAPNLIVFNEGAPDARLAPLQELSNAYKRSFERLGKWQLLGYGSEQGDVKLRRALAQMLRRDRGLQVDADQLCITRGSQMALYLCARLLITPGDVVAIENPGYPGAYKLFEQAGAVLVPIAVDRMGLNVDALEVLCQKRTVQAVYVTPHHQFPTAARLSEQRRKKLLQLARQHHFAIIEDDYEYHYGSQQPFALASSMWASNVIYISSLSKLIAPALRVGYITGPPLFMKSLIGLRAQIDRQGDATLEHSLGELLEDGTLNRQIKKTRTVYEERKACIKQALDAQFGKALDCEFAEAGLALWVEFKEGVDWPDFLDRLRLKGVQVVPPQSFYADGIPQNGMRLGFGSLNNNEIQSGIAIMAEVFRELKQK